MNSALNTLRRSWVLSLESMIRSVMVSPLALSPVDEALAAAEPDEEPDVPPHAARLSIMAAAKPRLNSFFILFLLL